MNKRKLKFGINIALIVLCIVCIGIFAYAYPRINRLKGALDQIDTDTTTEEESEEPEQDTGFWNIVLFGLDSRDADSLTTMDTADYGDKRSDCIIIISINRETNDVKLLSVYRDTYMKMRGKNFYTNDTYIYDKATHAYFYGSANLVPGDETKDAGPYFSIDMLERNLDIEIDNFVAVNFGIVANVIDALGGVEIELTQAECSDINQYIDEINEITGSSSEHITEPGTYLLDGVQATAYGRVRHTTGNDYKRSERQRTVMLLAAKKAQEADIDTLLDLVELVAPQLRTDLTTSEITSLVNTVRKFNVDDENGTAGYPFDVTDDMSYVYPDDVVSNVIQLHEYLYSETDYTPTDEIYEIAANIDNMLGVYHDYDNDVYNGTDTSDSSDSESSYDSDDGSSYDSGSSSRYDESDDSDYSDYSDSSGDSGSSSGDSDDSGDSGYPDSSGDSGSSSGYSDDSGDNSGSGGDSYSDDSSGTYGSEYSGDSDGSDYSDSTGPENSGDSEGSDGFDGSGDSDYSDSTGSESSGDFGEYESEE